jgi:hypothetical protein
LAIAPAYSDDFGAAKTAEAKLSITNLTRQEIVIYNTILVFARINIGDRFLKHYK